MILYSRERNSNNVIDSHANRSRNLTAFVIISCGINTQIRLVVTLLRIASQNCRYPMRALHDDYSDLSGEDLQVRAEPPIRCGEIR